MVVHTHNTHAYRSVRAHRPPAHVSLSPPPHTLTPSHTPPDLGGGETRERFQRLEEETDLLYQQFQHILPTITSSHPHTPTPVISVGVASSVGVTSSHSAPLTHLTTFTKTTPSLAPTYQLTKTTPTSIPKTTPTARTIVSSSSLITSYAGTKTTPTISEAPPTATPTSFQAGPSLDQLWKVSSQHTNRNETSITPNNAPSVSSPPCHTLTTAAVVSTPSLPTPPPITAPAEAILTKYMELASLERAAGETGGGGGGGGNSGREGLKDLSISEHSPVSTLTLSLSLLAVYVVLCRRMKYNLSLKPPTGIYFIAMTQNYVMIMIDDLPFSFGGVSDGNKSSDPFQDW